MKILFVCTGNTCRSPIAEGLLKNAVDNDPEIKDKVEVSSAGIFAEDGAPPSENSARVMKEDWGIDISLHKSKTISRQDVLEADLVLAMTRGHREAVLAAFPDAKGRVFTLKEYSFGKDSIGEKSNEVCFLDITDPYGMPIEVYRRCANEIEKVVEILIKTLKMKIQGY